MYVVTLYWLLDVHPVLAVCFLSVCLSFYLSVCLSVSLSVCVYLSARHPHDAGRLLAWSETEMVGAIWRE